MWLMAGSCGSGLASYLARPMLIGFMTGLCGSWLAARLMAGSSRIGIACMRELMVGSCILVGLGYVANGRIIQDLGQRVVVLC